MIVRLMEEKDLDTVCMLEESAFSMPWKKKDFQDMIVNEDAMYLVAEEEETGRIAGCCGVRNIVGEGDISNVVVREDMRNRGVGKEMLSALLREAEKRYGISEFTLEVRVSNEPAIALYESLGFKNEGIRRKFYEKPVEDAMIMWRR